MRLQEKISSRTNASVRYSVGPVEYSVWDSVRNSVENSIISKLNDYDFTRKK